MFLPSRVNIDVQTHSVSMAGLFSSDVDPDKLPAKRLLVVNITEVSPECVELNKVRLSKTLRSVNKFLFVLCCRSWM